MEEEEAVAGDLGPPPPGVVRHHQNRPVLSPIGTATRTLLVEVTPIRELEIPTQEDIQDKIQQIIQWVAVLTSILVEPILGVTRIRILQVDTLLQGAIPIRTLQADTLVQGVTPIRTPQVDTLLQGVTQIRIQGGGIIQISIQLLVVIQTNTQAEPVLTKEGTLTSTLQVDTQPEEGILISIQVGAIQIKGPLTSTLQVDTQSEPEIQDGVSLVVILEDTLEDILEGTLAVRSVVTPTGIQTIKSSVPGLEEGAICPGWEGLLSHTPYSPWDTSLNLPVLPKRPCWRLAWAL